MDRQTSETQSEPDARREDAMARAQKVASAVTLDHIRFVHFAGHALVSADRLSSHETDYTVGFTRPKVQRRDSSFAVSSTLVFTLDGKPNIEEPGVLEPKQVAGEPLASLRATIELQYLCKADAPELSDDDLSEFANVNVPFNSWGYWREYVQSGLARLGVARTIALPLFRVQTARKWMIEDQQLSLPLNQSAATNPEETSHSEPSGVTGSLKKRKKRG